MNEINPRSKEDTSKINLSLGESEQAQQKRVNRYDVFLNMVCIEPTIQLRRMKEMLDTELRQRDNEKLTTEALGRLHRLLKNGKKREEE